MLEIFINLYTLLLQSTTPTHLVTEVVTVNIYPASVEQETYTPFGTQLPITIAVTQNL
jgi:hypothetical protein